MIELSTDSEIRVTGYRGRMTIAIELTIAEVVEQLGQDQILNTIGVAAAKKHFDLIDNRDDES